jgi:hypothetical protein
MLANTMQDVTEYGYRLQGGRRDARSASVTYGAAAESGSTASYSVPVRTPPSILRLNELQPSDHIHTQM